MKRFKLTIQDEEALADASAKMKDAILIIDDLLMTAYDTNSKGFLGKEKK